MAEVVRSSRAIAHLARTFQHLAKENHAAAKNAAEPKRSAAETLGDHPMIGHERESGLRELVISFGRTGYIALYRFLPHLEEVRVLAIRHQRELDYPF